MFVLYFGESIFSPRKFNNAIYGNPGKSSNIE